MAGNDRLINILLKAKDQASGTIQNATGSLTKLNATLAAHATQFAIAGAAIAGALALMTKGAEEQRRTQTLLGFSLSTVNQSYQELGPAIEDSIAKTQALTGVSDELQRVALSKLITQTGSLSLSMEALPAVIDAAAFSGKDITRVVNTMGPAIVGATNTLTQLGIVFDKNATPAERLAIVMARVGGAAEASVTPSQQMKANLSDMSDKIGTALLPVLDSLSQKIADVAEFIGNLNPVTIKWIAGLAAATAGILLFLAVVPKLVLAFKAIKLAIASTGIGALIVGVGLLATAVIGLASSADKADPELDALNARLEESKAKLAEMKASADEASSALDGVKDKLTELQEKIAEFDKATGSLVKIIQRGFGGDVPDAIKEALARVQREVDTRSGFLVETFTKEFDNVQGAIETALGGDIPETMRQDLLLIKDLTGEGWKNARIAAKTEVDKMPDDVVEAMDETVAVVSDGLDTVKEQVAAPDWQQIAQAIPEPIIQGVDVAAASIEQFPVDTAIAMSATVAAVQSAVPQINSAFSQISASTGGGSFQTSTFIGQSPTLIQNEINKIQSFQQGLATQTGGLSFGQQINAPGQSAQLKLLQGLLAEAQAAQGGGGGGFTNNGTVNLTFPSVDSADDILLVIDALGQA